MKLKTRLTVGRVFAIPVLYKITRFRPSTQTITCNRKVQEVPQSQAASNPRRQEEERKDKNQRVQNKQMHEKHTDQLPLPQAR